MILISTAIGRKWGVLLVLGCVLGAVFFGSNEGVRGTDQYQYVEDTRTLSANLTPVTNLLFPAKLIREGDTPTPVYFHHNGPPLAVASWLSGFIDSYNAWVLMNLVCHLIVALSIYLIAIRFTTPRIAFWTFALYASSPISIWLTINALQEQFFAALVAVSLCAFVYRENLLAMLLGFAALIIGLLSHPLFVLPFVLYAIVVAIESVSRRDLWRACLSLSMLLGGMAARTLLVDKWFPSSFQPDLAAIISSAIPGESNMFWHYALEQRVVTIELIWEKFRFAVVRHFFKIIEAPFYFYTNVAGIALVYLLVRHFKSCWRILIPCALFMGLYVAMITLQQNQPRYQQIVAGASFVVLALGWYYMGCQRVRTWMLVSVLLLMLGIDGYLAKRVNMDARQSREQLTLLQTQLYDAGIDDNARLASFNLSPHSPLAITVKPRILLSIKTSMMDTANIWKALDYYQPTHAIVRGDFDMQTLGFDTSLIQSIEGTYFGDLRIFELTQSGEQISQ